MCASQKVDITLKYLGVLNSYLLWSAPKLATTVAIIPTFINDFVVSGW